jgi:hypothetical protein
MRSSARSSSPSRLAALVSDIGADRIGSASYISGDQMMKDRYGEPERGGSEWEPIKIFSKEMKTPTRRTRLPTHVSDSLPKLAKPT